MPKRSALQMYRLNNARQFSLGGSSILGNINEARLYASQQQILNAAEQFQQASNELRTLLGLVEGQD